MTGSQDKATKEAQTAFGNKLFLAGPLQSGVPPETLD